jgi:hypothetical protein
MTYARILVTGSRDFTSAPLVDQALEAAAIIVTSPDPLLVHGAARGLDNLSRARAEAHGWVTEGHPAQWNTHEGCRCKDHTRRCGFAGFRRNNEMIALGADLVLAFPMHMQNDRTGSRGTWHCAESAADRDLAVLIIWNGRLFPLGDAGQTVLANRAARVGCPTGSRGDLAMSDAVVPF